MNEEGLRAMLEMDPPVPVKPPENFSPRQHLHGNLMRLGQNHIDELPQIPYPQNPGETTNILSRQDGCNMLYGNKQYRALLQPVSPLRIEPMTLIPKGQAPSGPALTSISLFYCPQLPPACLRAVHTVGIPHVYSRDTSCSSPVSRSFTAQKNAPKKLS